jgi:hypothetical protein
MDNTDDPNRKAWTFFWLLLLGLFAAMAALHVLHL